MFLVSYFITKIKTNFLDFKHAYQRCSNNSSNSVPMLTQPRSVQQPPPPPLPAPTPTIAQPTSVPNYVTSEVVRPPREEHQPAAPPKKRRLSRDGHSKKFPLSTLDSNRILKSSTTSTTTNTTPLSSSSPTSETIRGEYFFHVWEGQGWTLLLINMNSL